MRSSGAQSQLSAATKSMRSPRAPPLPEPAGRMQLWVVHISTRSLVHGSVVNLVLGVASQKPVAPRGLLSAPACTMSERADVDANEGLNRRHETDDLLQTKWSSTDMPE